MKNTNDNNDNLNNFNENKVNQSNAKSNTKLNKNSKKLRGTNIAIIIMILLIITSLIILGVYLYSKYSKKSEKTNTEAGSTSTGTKTVMIYMCGSDLESQGKIGTLNLKDLMNSDIDYDNINIVLCAGGSEKWYTPEISTSETSIYTINKDGINKVQKQNKLDMGDEDTVTGFLDYVYDNYKTDEYYLMFWNHGSAQAGIEFDELSKNNIDLASLDNCLEASEFNSNDIKFDLVILNNCLMGSIETADIFSNYANYLVASEDVMYGDRTINTFEFLDGIKTDDGAIEIGKSYIDCYVNSTKKADATLNITCSLIDLSKIEDIIDNLEDYIEDIDLDQESYKKMTQIRSRDVYEYQKCSNYYDMVDLYELVTKLEPINSNNKNLTDSIEEAVIYNSTTDRHSNGISIYFPESNDWTKIYKTIDFSSIYEDFLEEYIDIYTGKKTISFSLDNKNIEKVENGFSMQLTEEEASIYKDSEFIVFEDNDDGTYTPVLTSPYTSIDDNGLITADIDKKIITLVDENKEPLLDLGYLFELDRTDEYTLFGLGMVLSGKPGEDYINSDEYSKLMFIKSKRTINLDENGNYLGLGEAEEVNGVELDIDDEFSFIHSDLDPSKKYVGVFCVEDVYGEKYFSKLINIEVQQ